MYDKMYICICIVLNVFLYSSKGGDTALHYAARNGELACMNGLLAAGADTSIQNEVRITSIHNL